MALQEFEMTDEDLATLKDAGKPTPAMWGSGGEPFCGTPQENANRAWERLGAKMDFKSVTVQPVAGKGQKFFRAEASTKEVTRREAEHKIAEEDAREEELNNGQFGVGA